MLRTALAFSEMFSLVCQLPYFTSQLIPSAYTPAYISSLRTTVTDYHNLSRFNLVAEPSIARLRSKVTDPLQLQSLHACADPLHEHIDLQHECIDSQLPSCTCFYPLYRTCFSPLSLRYTAASAIAWATCSPHSRSASGGQHTDMRVLLHAAIEGQQHADQWC